MKNIDIHGRIKSEAYIDIEAFIKESYLNHEYHILIIHGIGKNILSNMVHDFCKKSEYIQKYELAPIQLGGAGATLIYLKRRVK